MDTMSVNVATARSMASIAGVRERARDFLEGLVHPLATEAADTVVLIVSELVTNALRHGGGTCTLDLTAHPDSIDVAVHDSATVPAPRTAGWPVLRPAEFAYPARARTSGSTWSAPAWRRRRAPTAKVHPESE
ncbi:ATP-binding protein [Streptomyces sp. NPDC005506]|uniref:ATP-binding protein n=1 Tax=unclassified Streptomyces TaxID=2593676 RepID=UPI0036C40AFD